MKVYFHFLTFHLTTCLLPPSITINYAFWVHKLFEVLPKGVTLLSFLFLFLNPLNLIMIRII